MRLRIQLALAVTCGILNALVLKWLSVAGAPASTILALRGGGCLLVISIVAFASGDAWRPRNLRLQTMRLVLGGLALAGTITSYRYLSASTAALVARLDLPFTLIIGPLAGVRVSDRQRSLATAALVVAAIMIFCCRDTRESLVGYVLATGGALLIATGYLIVRRTALDEDANVLPLAPAVGSLGFGAVSGAKLVAAPLLAVGLASGVLMYLLYVLTRDAYRLRGLGVAELYAVGVALALLPLDYVVNGVVHPPLYVLGYLLLCGLIAAAATAIYGPGSAELGTGGTGKDGAAGRTSN